MRLSLLLLCLTAACYGAAFVCHLVSLSESSSGRAQRAGLALLRAGFLVGTFYLAVEAIEQGFFLPVAGLGQAMAFFAWALAFVYLLLLFRLQSRSFGLVLAPILFLLTAAACLSKLGLGEAHERPIPPALANPYFVLHIVTAFFAYASFALSFSAGILYLIQSRELKARQAGRLYHRLPSLEELERLIYQPLVWGAPLLAVAVGIGFVWSKAAFGEYWLLDPKTIATGFTGLVYFLILYLRYVTAVRGKQGAVLSLIAFALVVFSFVGTHFIVGSRHHLLLQGAA